MSGDIRAKKNNKMLNKTGGNKREKNKTASHLQTSDSQEDFEGEPGMMGLDREGEFLTRKEDSYDNVEEDRIIKTKPIRKTKRRELNKQKQHGRHHRQQTPPPPSYYAVDEDTASDEYEEYRNVHRKRNKKEDKSTCGRGLKCCVIGGIVLLVTFLGVCAFVNNNEEYKTIISNSESVKVLAANFVLPDFQDIQTHLNIETAESMLASLKDASIKAWEYTCYSMHQFSLSAKESCSNILNFLNTIALEIKSGEVFKDASQSTLEDSTNPNDDSEDYTEELKEWIESHESQERIIETQEEDNRKLVDSEPSTFQHDEIDVSKAADFTTPHIDTIPFDELDKEEPHIEPSFPDDTKDHESIKVVTTSDTVTKINVPIDEPVIEKTTVYTLG